MTERFLSFGDLANYLNLSINTVSSYSAKGMLPEPDVLIGKGERPTRGWRPETIDEWQANRPGRGNWGKRT